jgi:hypothetical protein
LLFKREFWFLKMDKNKCPKWESKKSFENAPLKSGFAA